MEQNTNTDSTKFFSDQEYSTIIKETERGFDPKTVKNIKDKKITPKQLKDLFNSEMQTSHILLVCRHMNVENGVEEYKKHVMAKAQPTAKQPLKGNSLNTQQGAQKLAQNVKNAARGLDID